MNSVNTGSGMSPGDNGVHSPESVRSSECFHSGAWTENDTRSNRRGADSAAQVKPGATRRRPVRIGSAEGLTSHPQSWRSPLLEREVLTESLKRPEILQLSQPMGAAEETVTDKRGAAMNSTIARSERRPPLLRSCVFGRCLRDLRSLSNAAVQN